MSGHLVDTPLGRRAVGDDPLRLGVLVSGRGSNMEAIIRSATLGRIPVSVRAVISDNPDAPALAKARSFGVEATGIPYPSESAHRDAFYREVIRRLRERDVEFIALAGYMRILPSSVLQAFPHCVLNIHPSLLPSFPGLHPHRQALRHGVKVSGCTVHLVDEGVDSGPIIAQQAVQVLDHDTEESLAARILQVEHELYPRALAMLASGRLVLSGRRVKMVPEAQEGEGRA